MYPIQIQTAKSGPDISSETELKKKKNFMWDVKKYEIDAKSSRCREFESSTTKLIGISGARSRNRS